MDKPIVPEFIQEKCTEKALIQEIKSLIAGPKRVQMLKEYAQLHQTLGSGGASKKVAQLITNFHK